MTTETALVTILGSTGSIGENTLAVIARQSAYRVFALSANSNVEKLEQQCRRFHPKFAVMADEAAANVLSTQLADTDVSVLSGPAALASVASHKDVQIVMAAIVGAAGLAPTLAAVETGKKVLLANKESLVMAGELFMQRVVDCGAILLPIDSEHNAIFQCLPASGAGQDPKLKAVNKVILTASGGPFLHTPIADFPDLTPDQACRHPNWEMGRKISVDSATLMNKGLEFIEACFLFGLRPNQLNVLIHPQSIVHSMVEYVDGSILAQLSTPDMRIPIAYGLAWPDRIPAGAGLLDLASSPALEFMHPDLQRFPCLKLGIEAASQRGTAPAILNAANEVAVAAFLDEGLRFDQIHRVVEEVMSKIPCEPAPSLDIIQQADQDARKLANELILKKNQY